MTSNTPLKKNFLFRWKKSISLLYTIESPKYMKTKKEIQDFLMDKDFLAWVNKPNPENINYWELWKEANPHNIGELEAARDLVRGIVFTSVEVKPGSKEKVLKGVISRIDTSPAYTINKKVRFSNVYSGIAAAVLVLLTTWYVLTNIKQQDQITDDIVEYYAEVPDGARSLHIKLPDGSIVWLNAHSHLKYTYDPEASTRVVDLIGEAFFEVEKNPQAPFIVMFDSLTITALGTSFNVGNYINNHNPEVALVTGKVHVKSIYQTAEEITLLPGEKAVLTPKGLEKSPFSYDEVIAWKDGVLYFENADFDEIRQRLEQWYGVTITNKSNVDKNWGEYTGRFRNASLERVLDRLSYTNHFRYTINDHNVIITN